jgi:hypothetical protein
VRARGEAIADAWQRFWFEPVSTAPLALFRIAFGLVAFFWGISLLPDVIAFYTKRGILPDQPTFSGDFHGAWGVLGIFESKTAAIALAVLLIVAAACLAVGLFSQLAALLVCIALLSFQRRNPFVVNAGDVLMRILAFYLIFAPAGAAFSIGRYLRHKGRDFWEFPRRAPWALRLLQIQFSVIYLMAAWTKTQGTTWNNGTAVSYALRIEDLSRFPVPSFVTHSELFSNVFSFGTLALELSLAILVWNRKLRPWVLLGGITLHLGIEYSIRVGFYGLAILSLYLVWLPPERAESILLWLRGRFSRRPGYAARSAARAAR